MIKPTIGRIVWYWPSPSDITSLGMSSNTTVTEEQPMAAQVVYVHSDHMVNLSVIDHGGEQHARTSVLLTDDKPIPTNIAFATWMPYQVNQAKKEDAAANLEVVVTIEDPVQAKELEAAIVAGGFGIASHITLEDIEASIVSESYFTAADGVAGASRGMPGADLLPEYVTFDGGPLSKVTFCTLILKNTAKVVGINYGPIDPNEHNAARGRTLARADAIDQIWPLMNYELRSRHAIKSQPLKA